jgi:hypothetical protein
MKLIVMKYQLVVTILLSLALLIACPATGADKYYFDQCVMKQNCNEQIDDLKIKLLHLTGLYEVFENPEEYLNNYEIKFYELKTKQKDPLYVGFISFSSDHSIFVVRKGNNAKNRFSIHQVINFGRIENITIVDVNNDGSEDFTCINYPKGTGMGTQQVIFLNQGNQLIRPLEKFGLNNK